MCTPDILADRFPASTCDTPASRCHVIIARAELHDRRQLGSVTADERTEVLTKPGRWIPPVQVPVIRQPDLPPGGPPQKLRP